LPESVPEIARLLMLANQWRIALKRMTPSDVKAASIELALKGAGINLNKVEMESIANDMREGKFEGKNVYDIIQDQAFQDRIALTFSGPAVDEQALLEHEPNEMLVVCKHCQGVAVYSLN
jgi:hypothetical protein